MGLSKKITHKSEMSRKILQALRARVNASKNSQDRQAFEAKWRDAEDRTVGYMHEREVDTLRKAERAAGKPTYTTIQIPYSRAVLLASHTYWTTVFLGRTPVVQMQGLHGEGEQQVLAVEALQHYQTNVGGHLGPYHTWLYDTGKYGHGVIGLYWDEEVITVSEIVENPPVTFMGLEVTPAKKVRQTRQVKGYHGNRLFNIRPLDFVHDPRVTVQNFQQGEFCGYWTTVSWPDFFENEKKGVYINGEAAKKWARGRKKTKDENTNVLKIPDSGDFGTAYTELGMSTDSIPAYELYVVLNPRDWGLGGEDLFEKWVFLVTEDFEVLLSARPAGALHNKFPFGVLKSDPEGYSIYTPGIPESTADIQNTVDWLLNSHFFNVRKTMNNEFVVDPSRVEMADLMNPLPGGIIRLKPAAAGTDARQAINQLQTVDVTRQHLADMDMMMQLGERVTGVNDQIMGVAAPSSRRSATEVRSTNTFAVNRLKTESEYFSATGFSPLSMMMVQNSQQYYDAERKFLIAGNAALVAGEKFINVTPDMISGFYGYVPVDGTLPVDRFAQATLWRALLGEMRQIPPLMAQFDIGKIFSYVGQLTGLKNIDQFRIQVVPDGLAQMQAQQGNIVPLGGAGGGTQPASAPESMQLEEQGRLM